MPTFGDGTLDIAISPIDFDVRTNPHFLRLLDQSINSERTSSHSYKSIVKNLRELDALIANELSLKEMQN